MNLESLESKPVLDVIGNVRPTLERRSRRRVRLQWQLSVLPLHTAARVLPGVTENLSTRGFCGILEEPLSEGDVVVCLLHLPRPNPACRALRCQAHVMWVRSIGDNRYAMGCRIDEYTVVA